MNRKERRRAARNERLSSVGTAGGTHRVSSGAAGLLTAAQEWHNRGRFFEAAAFCRRVLERDPSNAEALLVLGSASSNLGQASAAQRYLDQSIACQPADPRAWVVLTTHLTRIGKLQDAQAACRRAIELAPDFPAAHAALGSLLASQREFGLAEKAFRRALELRPGFVDAEINLGSTLFYQGRLEEALAAQRQALAHDPGHIHALRNVAATLRALGRYQEALSAYRQATAIAPDYAEAHRDEALLLLLLGRFEEGWSKYEWRWRASTVGAQPIEGPRWRGEPLAGRTILLQGEQGIGDTLQFLRYVPMVAARGGNVVLSLPSSLMRLSGDAISAASRTVSFDEPLPPYDCHAPLLSLPAIFATTLDTLPRRIPYIRPPSDCTASWKRELNRLRGFRVGLVWSGNPIHENDHNRSISFRHLLPLLSINKVSFFSLQVGERCPDVRLAPEGRIIDLSARLSDFCETAGAIEALDLVIAVDTAVAHLAGALGKPVWLLLPHVPDWRWLLGRDESLWYSSMRLFRQERRGEWDSVIARVCEELDRLIGRNLGVAPNTSQSPVS